MLKLHGSHIEDVDGDGDVTEDGVGMQLHDPAAVWFAIDNPPLSDDELGWGGGGNRGLRSGWKVLRRRFVIERSVLPSPLIPRFTDSFEYGIELIALPLPSFTFWFSCS